MKAKRLYAIGALLALIAAGQAFLRLTGGDDDGRVGVSGTVTSGGTPLESGRIQFTPDAGSKGPVAWGTIEGGRFKIPRANGPVAGTYRVTVFAGPPPSKEPLIRSPKLGKRPGKKRTVRWPAPVAISTSDAENTRDFDLPP